MRFRTNAVVAILVLLSEVPCVGAVGLPVNAGLAFGANVDKSILQAVAVPALRYIGLLALPTVEVPNLLAVVAFATELTVFHVPSPAKKWLALPSLFGAKPFAVVDTTAVLALPWWQGDLLGVHSCLHLLQYHLIFSLALESYTLLYCL